MEGRVVRLRQEAQERREAIGAAARDDAAREPRFAGRAILRAKELAPLARDKAKSAHSFMQHFKAYAIGAATFMGGTLVLSDVSMVNHGRFSGGVLIAVTPLAAVLTKTAFEFSKKSDERKNREQNNLERLRNSAVSEKEQLKIVSRYSERRFHLWAALAINPHVAASALDTMRRSKRFNLDLWRAYTAANAGANWNRQMMDQEKLEQEQLQGQLGDEKKPVKIGVNPEFEVNFRRSLVSVGFYERAMEALESRSLETDSANRVFSDLARSA